MSCEHIYSIFLDAASGIESYDEELGFEDKERWEFYKEWESYRRCWLNDSEPTFDELLEEYGFSVSDDLWNEPYGDEIGELL